MGGLASLIGPAIGGISSIVGGLMNTSSAQSINAQQMQLGIQNATGQFLGPYMRNLVGAAKSAGINPLAALGVSSPGFSGSLGATEPGQGLMSAGKSLIGADLDAGHIEKMKSLEVRKAETEIQSLNAGLTNTMIEAARNKYTLDYLRNHPELRPEGASDPTLVGGAAGWLNNLNEITTGLGSSMNRMFSRIPQSMWNTP